MKVKTKYLLQILLLVAALPLTAKANNYPVTVSGFVFGFDWSGGGSTGVRFPLAGARVELLDSDADGSQLFDDLMGTAIVNPDGSFTVSGSGGDPGSFSWSKPDVYVRFVYNYNDKVRLTDELNRTRYSNTPEHDHDNFEGTLNIGSWIIGMDISKGESSKCGVWYNVRKAWDNYVGITGEEPKPGYCDVEYWSAIYAGTPWTNDNTIHWPIHYSSSAAPHEFGHIIRHSFDGDRDHFNWDVTRFRYARNHSSCDPGCNNWSTESVEMNRAFAFNEGWAEFWAKDAVCSSGLSTECEGGVAHILRHLEDSLRSKFPQPRKFMCTVLKNNPESIHSIQEYIEKMKQMPGMSMFSLNTATLPKSKNPSPVTSFKPLAKEVVVSSVSKDLKKITVEISTLNTKISEKSSSLKSATGCRGELCPKYADLILSVSALENKRDLLLLQKDMMQKSITENYYDNIPKRVLEKSVDQFKTEMRNYYTKRINEINVKAFKYCISRLQSIKTTDPYITELIKELQKKMNTIQEKQKNENRLTKTAYIPYDGENIRRGEK